MEQRTIVIGCELQKLNCDRCNREFQSLAALKLHQLRVHTTKAKRLHCKKCLKSFASWSKLRNHDCVPPEAKEFLEIPVKETKEKKLEPIFEKIEIVAFSNINCIKCESVFKTFDDYQTHQENCIESEYCLLKAEAHYKCHKCSASFPTLQDRFQHLARHISCADCHCTSFKNLFEMRQHVRQNHGKCPCYACHLVFSTVSNLKQHMADSHSDILGDPGKSLKEMVMDVWPKVKEINFERIEDAILSVYPNLAVESDLVWRGKLRQILNSEISRNFAQAEIVIQQNSKYYLCCVCGANIADLTEHSKKCSRRLYHPAQSVRGKVAKSQVVGRKNLCEFCFQSFHWKVDLRNHRRKEHNVAHRCESCEQTFTTLGFLRKHREICSNKVLILGKEDEDD